MLKCPVFEAREETSPGTFGQWQITFSPGDYIFEDFGMAFTIVAQCCGEEAIIFSFPLETSQQSLGISRYSHE
jgi:hypothetical protein